VNVSVRCLGAATYRAATAAAHGPATGCLTENSTVVSLPLIMHRMRPRALSTQTRIACAGRSEAGLQGLQTGGLVTKLLAWLNFFS
jgi:hypothetical protein